MLACPNCGSHCGRASPRMLTKTGGLHLISKQTLQHTGSWQARVTGGQIQEQVTSSTHLRWGTVPEQQRNFAARWQPQQRRG